MAISTGAPAPIADASFSRSYRTWLLTLMLAVNVLNMADRQGLAAIAPALKADLRLSDTELGLIQGLGFAIFYTVMGLPLARLAESRRRVTIIGVSVAVFATMAALCGSARNFTQILAARIGVAIGDAGFGPPVSSLLGDHFPAQRRTTIMTIIWLGAPIGAVLGSAVGGWVAQTMGWRSWFILLSVPSLVVAALVLLTLREPPRGMIDGGIADEGPPPPMRDVIAFLWSKRSMRHVLIGSALGAIALNGIGQFLGRFLVSSLNLSLEEAGATLGLLSLTAMASGFALGGFGMDWAARSDRAWYARGPAVALLVSVPLLILGFAQDDLTLSLVFLLFGQVALFIFFTPSLALAQNMVDARMRASSAFVIAVMVSLIGTGIGPTITGILSDFYASRAFDQGSFPAVCLGALQAQQFAVTCEAASSSGLRHALLTLPLLAGLASVHFWLASRSLAADLDRQYQPAEAEGDPTT